MRCKTCLALLGLHIFSCTAESHAHDHSEEHTAAQELSVSGTDFVSWLGTETPGAHVQHMFEEINASNGIYSWMLEASRCVVVLSASLGIVEATVARGVLVWLIQHVICAC